MSDVWQGPGWWLAPDGKWYPADGGPDSTTTSTIESGDGTAGVNGAAQSHAEAVAPESPGGESPTLTTSEPVTPTSVPTSGWQAVGPADDIETIADVSEPEAPSTVLGADADAVVVPKPGGTDPIERDDAWRKPADTSATLAEPTSPTGAATVVDLAVPETQPDKVDQPAGFPWGSILKGVGIVAGLVIIALLVNVLFFSEDGNDVNLQPGESSSSAPSTTESTTTSVASTTEAAPSSAVTEPQSSSEAPSSTTGASIEGTEVSVFDLRQGDCIESDIGSGQIEKLIAVDCDTPHEFEVYREALIDNTITEYDADAIQAQAEDVCRTSLAAYIPEDDERNLMFKWFQPTEESWNQPDPDRVITCLLFDEDEKLVGRAG